MTTGRKERLVSPSPDQLALLRQPLTRGERLVLDAFDRALDPAWEIYVQPHLNGLRPDFVLLNPAVGIGVFEVKDWDLDAVRYEVCGGERPHLVGNKDGTSFSLQSQNPVLKARYYREAIYKLYCPRLREQKGFAAITAGVIFPFASSDRVRRLLEPLLTKEERNYRNYFPVSGAQEIASGRLDLMFPESHRQSSVLMTEETAGDLRRWLVDPDFSKEQRKPLELDAGQRLLAETRTESGFRRIRGAAGSGKSHVLAARAAQLASEGRSVLVATFNITLWHYLRDLVARAVPSTACHRNIIYRNFHSWCADVCREVGWDDRYGDLWKMADKHAILSEHLPRLVAGAADEPAAPRYDAILVDEGQDYLPEWWATLRKFLEPRGEMILVADATQDIYGTANAWTSDAMSGAGFRGAWAQLEANYRLPPAVIPLVAEFAGRFLQGEGLDLPVPPQGSLDLEPVALRWVQCPKEEEAVTCGTELRRLANLTRSSGFAIADITFLASDVATGSAVVGDLEAGGMRCVSTFASDSRERRREKMAFYMGDARVKATTLHSFKGWESSMLLVHVNDAATVQSAALVYAALTRLKRRDNGSHLVVVCSCSEFEEFGALWPDFVRADSGTRSAGINGLLSHETLSHPRAAAGG